MIEKQGISLIIPFLNEEEAIPIFCETIDEHAKTLSFPVELVFVNDGSTDKSLDVLRSFAFENIRKVKLVDLSKNFGSHAAVRAGILNASYDICTWMGMDLQEPFEIITISHDKIASEGFDAVYFEKKTVKVSAFNRMFSKIYSHLMQKYAVKTYSSDGTSTIAFGPKIKEFLNENIESNSSIMLQIMDAGFVYDTVSIDYNARSAGTSKWTLGKKIKLFIDSFVSFSFMPIRLVSIVGIIIFILGIIIGIVTIVNWIVNPSVPLGYSTIVSTLAIGFGITNISLGIIAEYLWRAYDAARGRPVFIISEVLNLTSDEDGEDEDENS